MREIKKISPFKRFCTTIGEIPTSYLESMTYYETLMWLCNFVEKTVDPAINNNALAIQELQEYVTTYFDSLDVQEKINNKLDEMAESGELENIISSYIRLKSLLCFNTLSDLKDSENLNEGVTAIILGKNTFNDGGTCIYKIRTITSHDIVDENNIISINTSDTLIGEKIVKKDKILIVGDSWSMNNYPYITDQNNMWYNLLAKKLNMRVKSYAESGAGYNVENNKFRTQINQIIQNEKPEEISKIIVFGGINDLSNYTSDSGELYNECNYILNQLKNTFTNTEIIVIGINTPDKANNPSLIVAKDELNNATLSNSCKFVDSIPFMLGFNTLFQNNHPNENGQKFLSGVIYSAMTGSFDRTVVKKSNQFTINKNENWYPDLESNVYYHEDKMIIELTINLTSQFGSSSPLIYNFPEIDFRKSNTSLILRPQYDPALSNCLLDTSTNNVNNLVITVPKNVTGKWIGYVEIPY